MPIYHELEASVLFTEPRIWRRFLIRASGNFADLHHALQDAFGWTNSHLFEFRAPDGERLAGLPDMDVFADEPATPDAAATPLRSFFEAEPPRECEYIYDFGDDWRHRVKLVARHEEEEAFERRLLDGDRSGPPEDCGGIEGYERMLHFCATGEDAFGDDPDELAAWLGDWRPDAFELATAKQQFDR
jgi:hypothetical protein